MTKYTAKLITVFAYAVMLVAACTPARAQETDVNGGGFATYTYVQDDKWFPNVGQISLYGSISHDAFALKGAISNNRDMPIRRLALEFSGGVYGDNLTVQVGRLPRLATLFADVYGAPSDWGMAILPLSMYSRRMVHSTSFQTIEGIKFQWDHKTPLGYLRTTVDAGRNVEEKACEWQMEALRKPCNNNWSLVRNGHNYDYSAELFNGRWTAVTSWSRVSANSRLNNANDKVAVFYTKLAPEVNYGFWRTALRYAGDSYFVQAEHGESRTRLGDMVSKTARDDYVLAGYEIKDNLSVFTGYSRGKQRNASTPNEDRYVGGMYRVGGCALTLEYHNGFGGWQQSSGDIKWASYVASATWGF